MITGLETHAAASAAASWQSAIQTILKKSNVNKVASYVANLKLLSKQSIRKHPRRAYV